MAGLSYAKCFLGETDAAISLAKRVRGKLGKIVNPNHRNTHYVLGMSYFKKRNYELSKENLEKALYYCNLLSNDNFNLQLTSSSYKTLSLVAQQLNDHEESYALLDKSFEVKEDNILHTRDLQVNNLASKLELGDKKKQIKGLTKKQLEYKIALQEQKNRLTLLIGGIVVLLIISGAIYRNYYLKKRLTKQLELKHRIIQDQYRDLENLKDNLEESLTEKEVLLKEIHHRVKNNFQLVISLLNLQAKKDGVGSIDDFLKEGTSRIVSMSLVHNNLYQTDNLGAIDFEDYVVKLSDAVFSSFATKDNPVDLNIDSTKMVFDIHTAIPLGLILNEMLVNTMKHVYAKKERTAITVKLSQENDQEFRLYYTDNGESFKAAENKSFGFELIRLLVKQIKGIVKMEEANPISYAITFPINPTPIN